MTCRRIAPANVGRMTIGASEITILVDSQQFAGYVKSHRAFVMALKAGGDWHVGLQPAQGCGFCNVDMTGGALGDMLFAAVPKLQ